MMCPFAELFKASLERELLQLLPAPSVLKLEFCEFFFKLGATNWAEVLKVFRRMAILLEWRLPFLFLVAEECPIRRTHEDGRLHEP